MNIETKRYHVIEKIMNLTEYQLDNLERILLEESKLSISLDSAIQEVHEGQVKSHNEVRKKYQKWL